MDKNTIPEEWIKTVKERFKNGVPNGWLLHWDENRFSEDLKKLSNNFEFVNSTNFDYAFCNSYYLFIPSQASETYEMATIEISFIVNAYQIFWTHYFDYGKNGRIVSAPGLEAKKITTSIGEFLNQKGFEECLLDWNETKISGIQLELSGEDVTLGKCLFVDYED